MSPGGPGPSEPEPAGAEPGGTDPAWRKPGGANPGGTGPPATEPGGADPAGTKPVGTKPDGTKPGGTKPGGTDPAGAKQAATTPAGEIPGEALAWLRTPQLRPLWSAVHARLRRNGRTVAGRLTLDGLNHDAREGIGRLLGRAVEPRHTVNLAELDRLLRTSAAGTGLLGVVEAVLGPVPDRRAEAAAEAGRRDLLREHAAAAVAAAGLDGRDWTQGWLERLWRTGLPARLPAGQGRHLVSQAATVLGLTVGDRARLWSRGELAQQVTGSAHGLDDDAQLTRLVLPGLALALTGAPEAPADAAGRRGLWEAAGVSSDTVATTVLVCGLRPGGDDWRAAGLRERAERGAETHLSLREVRALGPLRLAAQTVYVCENPRVIEAAVTRGAPAALVCTMGNPTIVTLTLLDAVAAVPGVRLAYHGDFDWPGVAIAERVLRRYGATPWRLSAADYRSAVAAAAGRGTPLPPLAGRAGTTGWDPRLARAMVELGLAVHEEAVIDTLLADLWTAPAGEA